MGNSGIRTSIVCAALVFAFAAAFPLSAGAESLRPEEVEVRTEFYPPAVESLPIGQYDYDVSWQGIPVAVAKVTVKKYQIGDKEYYYAEAAARTARTISWAYKLRHISESLFEAQTFKPLSFYSHDIERRRQRHRKIVYGKEGQVHSEYWKNEQLKEAHDFNPNNYMLDPISAAFMARSVELKVGKVVSVDVFNAKERYLITFHVESLETLKVNGKKRLAYKVVPSVQKMLNPNSKRRFKSATLWIAADASRDVLRLKSKVWIGSINSTFEGFTPGNPEPEPLTPLQVKNRTRQISSNLVR